MLQHAVFVVFVVCHSRCILFVGGMLQQAVFVLRHSRCILLVGGLYFWYAIAGAYCLWVLCYSRLYFAPWPLALPGSGHTAPFRPSHHSGYQHVLIQGAYCMECPE